ncbi:MAG: T9SS type A sorting domain-containing protein [Weeksellaceae bacterium]
MKKLLQAILCIGICTGIHNSLSAQEVIIEQIKVLPDSPLKFKHNFPKEEYTKISDENGRKMYVTNDSLFQNSLSFEENTQYGNDNVNDVSLSVNLAFDTEEYEPGIIRIYNEEGYDDIFLWNGENPFTIDVPAGVYDLFMSFAKWNPNPTDYIIIKEMIDVEEENTININIAEAANHITTKLLNENGEMPLPGILNPDTGTITGGNAEVIADRLFHFNPTNKRISSFGFLWGYRLSEEDDLVWNFYINDVSERYTIAQSIFAVGYEGDNYFSKYPLITGISASIDLENNPEDYVFHQEKFQPSVLGESSEAIYTGLSTYNAWEGASRGGWGIHREIEINPEEGFRAYLNNPFNDEPWDLLVFPAIIDHIGTIDPNMGDEGFLIEGNCIISGDNNEVLYGSGADIAGSWYFLGNVYYDNIGTGESQFLPFHNQFTFSSSENPEIIQGNNVPISVVGTMMLPAYEINYLLSNYKGRYGEMRESDFFNTTVEAKQNGNTIYSGNYTDFYAQYLPLSPDGIWDITFTNTNVEVDGIPGKNITHIIYEGEAAPTLQHLQFRNTNDQVTDRFESAENGTVRLAAGDFEFDAEASIFAYNEGNSVEFFYSRYNESEWTELELTEYPEHFFMPGFGDYYEASLASVVVPEDNSWFDVKVICTDAAGNKQEQVISPAFKIEQATMGIEEIDKSGFTVYPNPFTNEINIKLPENLKGNYTFKVSDITGKLIFIQKNRTESQFVWNGTSLPKGIYILSIENNGKVIAQKVIKK